MKLMKKAVALLLIWSLTLWPVMETMAQEGLPQKPEAGKVIVVSEKVGETIDREERDYYRLFLSSKNFQSAVILLLPDGSYVMQITEEKEGIQQLREIPTEQQALDSLREYIDNFTAADRMRRLAAEEATRKAAADMRKAAILKARVAEAREQAKMLAREKWTPERWREERLNDRGLSYRQTGGTSGLLLGAAAGMLIGKGFQGKKVARTVYHSGEWGDPWTENFYSYEHKYAPHWGLAIGSIAGAAAGAYLGKKADKEYYILVPRDIRLQETKSSTFANVLLGAIVVGPAMGGISGWALCTPMSGRAGETDMDENAVLGGYILGAISGATLAAAFSGRENHMSLWEKSLLEDNPTSSMNIQFMPLDPSAFTIHPIKLPDGETFYEYRVDLLRIRF